MLLALAAEYAIPRTVNYLFLKALLLVSVIGCGSGYPGQSSLPTAVFGQDDRLKVLPSEFPFSAIGKLSSLCSGVLVGADLVLTAAHCLNLHGQQLSVLRFSHIGKKGNVVLDSKARVLAVGTKDTKSNPGSDWAILRLDKPLGNKLGWLGLRKYSSWPTKVNHMGFPGDMDGGNTLAVDFNCRSFAHSRDYLAHDCGTWGGSSGGPLVVREGNQNYVVGLHVLGMNKYLRKFEANQANLAIPASAFYDQLVNLQ